MYRQKKQPSPEQVKKIIRKHVLNKGVWILTNLSTYEMEHFPHNFCYVNEDDPDEIIIKNEAGRILGRVTLRDFNITWNYDKRHLIKQCEERNFQVGLHQDLHLDKK